MRTYFHATIHVNRVENLLHFLLHFLTESNPVTFRRESDVSSTDLEMPQSEMARKINSVS
jgi:hypothetical protein